MLTYFIICYIIYSLQFCNIILILGVLFLTTGEVLKLYRIANGYDTKIDLEVATGISRHTLSCLERDVLPLSKAIMQDLASVYNVPFTRMHYSFIALESYNFQDRKQRREALAYVLKLCLSSSKT